MPPGIFVYRYSVLEESQYPFCIKDLEQIVLIAFTQNQMTKINEAPCISPKKSNMDVTWPHGRPVKMGDLSKVFRRLARSISYVILGK